jgi:hypothetical protein
VVLFLCLMRKKLRALTRKSLRPADPATDRVGRFESNPLGLKSVD